jgi:hypothetical protein
VVFGTNQNWGARYLLDDVVWVESGVTTLTTAVYEGAGSATGNVP